MNEKQMHDSKVTVQELRDFMKKFVAERDWTQYHTPKNLSMSIAVEAAELMEKFQFVSNEESIELAQSHKQEIAYELCDVFAYLLSFANAANIDLSSYYMEKMALNAKKYPADVAKGAYAKYTKLDAPKK
jgi:dCTP diphosphatase